MIRRVLRRPRWLSRPVAVIAATVVGLGALGGASGAVLGELGGAGTHRAEEHRHGGDRFGRIDADGDRAGNAGPGSVP